MSAIASPSDGRRSQDTLAQRLVVDRSVVAVALLVVFTLVLRLSQIHQSLFGDEVYTYTDIYGRTFGSVLANVNTGAENSPPLFFILAYATAKLGNPTVWIRLPSVVLSSATLIFVYLTGRDTIGRWAGVLAAALIAVSPFSLYYGVEARPYATMAFFVSVSTWALLRALDTDRRAYWVTFGLATAGAAYSHYTSIFVLGVQAAWALWVRRDRIRAPLAALAAAVVLYIPWLPNVRGKALDVIGVLQPLTAINVLRDLMRPIVGYPYAGLRAIPTPAGLIAVMVCALVGAWFVVGGQLAARGGAFAARFPELRLPPRRFWFLVLIAITTPIGLLLYSMVFTDLWLARGLYASMPAAALVFAGLLTAIPKPFNLCAILVVFAVLVVGTVRAASPSWRRPPLRAIAAYVDRTAGPADPVSLASPFGAPGILEQFNRYHHVVSHYVLFQDTPRGDDAVLVLDDALARDLHSPLEPAAPRGFVIVAHRHFGSAIVPIDVTSYRRVGSS